MPSGSRVSRFAWTPDFDSGRVARTRFTVIVERVHRSDGVTAGALKTLDGGNQVPRNEHELEIEGSRHVLDGREPRVHRGALEV
jgi:hypothetical protein